LNTTSCNFCSPERRPLCFYRHLFQQRLPISRLLVPAMRCNAQLLTHILAASGFVLTRIGQNSDMCQNIYRVYPCTRPTDVPYIHHALVEFSYCGLVSKVTSLCICVTLNFEAYMPSTTLQVTITSTSLRRTYHVEQRMCLNLNYLKLLSATQYLRRSARRVSKGGVEGGVSEGDCSRHLGRLVPWHVPCACAPFPMRASPPLLAGMQYSHRSWPRQRSFQMSSVMSKVSSLTPL
jgi:hypothetical protein